MKTSTLQKKSYKVKGRPMAKLGPIQNTPLCFIFVPREVSMKHGKPKLRLAAFLEPPVGLPHTEVVASVKNHKRTITYSHQMRKFIRKSGYHKSDFKPLEKYLLEQIKNAQKNPQAFLSLLATYLANGQAPTFTMNFQPQPPIAPTSEFAPTRPPPQTSDIAPATPSSSPITSTLEPNQKTCHSEEDLVSFFSENRGVLSTL
jgi:hypothetical protein